MLAVNDDPDRVSRNPHIHKNHQFPAVFQNDPSTCLPLKEVRGINYPDSQLRQVRSRSRICHPIYRHRQPPERELLPDPE